MSNIPFSYRTPTCATRHEENRPALYAAVYIKGEEESRALLCEECAGKKAALRSPYLTLRRLTSSSHVSRTGKPLCTRCRKLATHEGGYHRSFEQPAYLFLCAEHAQTHTDALPLAELQAALWELGIKAVPRTLQARLAEMGATCPYEACQDALWVRYPETFGWSKLYYYVDSEMARAEAEQRAVPEAFQRFMDGLLTGDL